MQIEVHELELRHAALRVSDATSASRMRASLAADGQQSPVTVITDGACAAQPYVLIDGYLRVSALRALGHDVVSAVTVELSEADALIMGHRLTEVGRRSALEEGWLLDELVVHHGLTQEQLGKRLSRSRSWVNRRLSLVYVLPSSAQLAVRDGVIAAQAAMKYLVPLSRDNQGACERMVLHLGQEPVTVREVEQLYTGWRRGNAEQRERIESHPRLFLQVQDAHRESEQSDTSLVVRDLDAISGACFRVRRKLDDGVVDCSRPRLVRAYREAQRAFATLTERMQESCDAGPIHAHGDREAVQGGPRSPHDSEDTTAVA
jgi:ParB family transcriptional regulator, chromosome partitioning protein